MDEIAKIKASLEARIKELNFVDSHLTNLLEMMSGRGESNCTAVQAGRILERIYGRVKSLRDELRKSRAS